MSSAEINLAYLAADPWGALQQRHGGAVMRELDRSDQPTDASAHNHDVRPGGRWTLSTDGAWHDDDPRNEETASV